MLFLSKLYKAILKRKLKDVVVISKFTAPGLFGDYTFLYKMFDRVLIMPRFLILNMLGLHGILIMPQYARIISGQA